jgi:phosphoglycerol transferase
MLFKNKESGNIGRSLSLIIILMAAYMLFRNYGVYPSVVDEYTYSSSSRLLSIGDTLTPNYLYKIIFRTTNLCGSGWLECARLINIIFYVCSVPLIYLVASKFLSEKKSLLITILSIIGPVSTYTAYFMPESMYYFFFWLLILVLASNNSLVASQKIFTVTIILGLLSLIKPHAFFLIIPIFLYGIYINYSIKNNIFYWAIKFILILSLGIIVTKLVIAYYFSGNQGLTLFGAGYNGLGSFILNFALANIENMFKVVSEVIKQIIGHWAALSIIFGPLLCVLVSLALKLNNKLDSELTSARVMQKNFAVLTLLMLLCMSGISSFFAAGMGVQLESEASRLHMRYYNFLLPMILISGMLDVEGNDLKRRFLISIPFICLVIYVISTAFVILKPNYVDSPEMRGIYSNKFIFYTLALGSLAAIILWIKKPKISLMIFIFLIYPCYLIASNYYVNLELRNRMYLSPYDKVAIFAAQFLTKKDTSNLVLIAPPSALGVQVLSQIYIDNPNVRILTLPEGSAINEQALGRSFKWVASSGEYPLDLPSNFGFKFDGFQINRIISKTEVVDLSSDRWPGYIEYVKGLGPAEPWGRWSRGKIVEIKFINPLPLDFSLRINASPYGNNVNKNFLVIVGKQERTFVLSGNNQEVVVDFSGEKNSHTIKIIIPEPSEEVGPMNGLGFGLIKLEIESKGTH